MKHNSILLAMLAMATTFAGCVQNDVDDVVLSAEEGYVTVTISTSKPTAVDENGSRTYLGATTSGKKAVLWSKGDKLSSDFIGTSDSNWEFTLVEGDGTPDATFEGKIPADVYKKAVDGSDPMLFIYPYLEVLEFTNKGTTDNRDGSWLGGCKIFAEQPLMAETFADNFNVSAGGLKLTGHNTAEPLVMKNVGGLLRLNVKSDKPIMKIRITAENGKLSDSWFYYNVVPAEGSKLYLNHEDGSDTVTLTSDTAVEIAENGTNFYAVVLPNESLNYNVTLYTEGVDYTETVTIKSAIAAGTIQTAKIDATGKFPAAEVVDLSANGTANTYVVNAANTVYKFKANVKGNGAALTDSNGGSVSTEITPAKAQLVWWNTPKLANGVDNWTTECPIVKESVKLEGDYISFRTPVTYLPGNVLLAACDEAGTILWSWNIWASEEGYDVDATAIPFGKWTFMDRNIGALGNGVNYATSSDKRIAAWAAGHFYQWGRKDPFPAGAVFGSNFVDDAETMQWGIPTYTDMDVKKDRSATTWGAANMMFVEVSAENCYPLKTNLGKNNYSVEEAVEASVKYPYRWMTYEGANTANGSSYSWMLSYMNGGSDMSAPKEAYLWGNTEIAGLIGKDQIAADAEYGNKSTKTIYDPCPAGYKVATPAAMSWVMSRYGSYTYNNISYTFDATTSLNGYTWKDNGYVFTSNNNTIFLPYVGHRMAGNSNLIYFGASMYSWYHTSGIAAGSNHTSWRSHNYDGKGLNTDYLGAGFPVRCVAE